MAKRALLLIDLENEFLHPRGALAGDFPTKAAPMLAAVSRLIKWARVSEIPIIWARLAFREPGNFDAVRDPIGRSLGALVDGTWGTQVLEALDRTDADIVVTKKRPSAFFQTDLILVLCGLGITELVVGGVSTNWAVESTVRDGHSHGFDMIVVREATATPFEEYHEPSLRSMGAIFAKVVSLDDFLADAEGSPPS